MAWFGVLLFWLMFGYRLLEDGLFYWSDMFSSPVVKFASGFYVIVSWGGSSFDYGARDVCVFCWGKEQYLLDGV